MRWVGSICILLAGYLLSICLLRPWKEHVALLQEGNFLFHLMESGIRNARIPLPRLLGEIAQKTESDWRCFFQEMKETLEVGPDVELTLLFEQLLYKNMDRKLSEEEIKLFFQFGRGILTGDMLFLRDNMEQISSVLEKRTADLRQQLSGRTKVTRVFCLSVSILTVLILL